MSAKKNIHFKDVISSLLDNSVPFPAVHLPQFSDLSSENAFKLSRAWKMIAPQRRIALLEDLEEIINTDTLMSFEEVAKIALHDPEARVRELAILLVWEFPDEDLLPTLTRMAMKDADVSVRAQAASILGNYIFEGEIEEISKKSLLLVENTLLGILNGEDDSLVRRRALESLGFSSKDHIPGLIETAYQNPDLGWKASALMAMGRNADIERWEKAVNEHLFNDQYDLQMEAIRAAGNLEMDSARQPLLNMLNDGMDDEELRDMVIWALSHIGGDGVMEAFKDMLEKSEDEEETEFLEDAIDTLMIESGEGLDSIDLLGLDLDSLDVGNLDDDDLDDAEKDEA